MSPFERLGIAASADEREIKRAYARELRRSRPDEDPAGFQDLHDAYRHCLAYAEHRRSLGEDGEDEDEDLAAAAPERQREHHGEHGDGPVAEPPESDRAEASEPPSGRSHASADDGWRRPPSPRSDDEDQSDAFDGRAFLDELLQRASDHGAAELERWLLDLEPLYSLDLKQALRAPVAHALAMADPPLTSESVRTIAAFFALDSVNPREDWLQEQLHQASRRAEAAAEFEQTVATMLSPRVRPVDRMLMRELLGPYSLWRRVLIALVAMLPTRLMSLWSSLQQIDPQLAATRLDAGSMDFWHRATDRHRIDVRRALLAAARIVLYPLLLLGFFAAFGPRNSLLADLPRVWFIGAAIWLSLACVRMLTPLLPRRGDPGVLSFRDRPLLLVAALAVLALGLAPVSTDLSALAVVGMAVTWMVARGVGRIYRTVWTMFAGLVVAVCLPDCFAIVLGTPAGQLRAIPDAWLPLYLAAGVATPVAQDLHLARLQRTDLQTAREQASWLRPLLVAAALLLIVRGLLWA
ncbi:hypothetical protein [Lysobacter sp. 1R34A]|uniref:hypothetical protein n=1 Tax=Lysobacter sp. 1R34A TaxID=3445786 RepID=UPI003EEB9F50